jgi:hypothetical protein
MDPIQQEYELITIGHDGIVLSPKHSKKSTSSSQ